MRTGTRFCFDGNVDFTQGPITQEIIHFAVPIMLGELLQNLYNSVDSLIVGNYVGDIALGAVSVCGTLSYLIIGFFTGISIGASVVISRAFGRNDRKKLSESMQAAFSFAVLLGLILSALGIVFAPNLLSLAAVKEAAWTTAVTYLRIYLAGILFTIIYNVGAGILRAIGDTQTPFYILVVACVVNIVLDLFLTGVLGFGVAGVGIATVGAQALSVLLVYQQIKKKSESFTLSFRQLSEQKRIIADIMRVSIPSGIQNSLISLSNLFVWRFVNGFDMAAAAGVGVAQRLDRFVAVPGRAIGLALTTLVSQNDGAGKNARIADGIRKGIMLALASTLVISAAFYIFSDASVAIFNDNPAVIEIGSTMMRTLIPFYTLMVMREIMLGMMRGFGDTKVPMILSLIGMVGIRQIYLAVSMQLDRSIVHIYYCYPITWGLTLLMTVIYYLICYKNGRPI